MYEDLLEVDKVHSDHVEEGCYVKQNAKHKWFYLSKQSRDEITLSVAWDSKNQQYFGTSISTAIRILAHASCSYSASCCVPAP
jgi:hypothetical protein